VTAAEGQAIALAREAEGHAALVAVNAGRDRVRLGLSMPADPALAPIELPGLPSGRLLDASTIELPPQGALVLV
jgi:hypothetical protein